MSILNTVIYNNRFKNIILNISIIFLFIILSFGISMKMMDLFHIIAEIMVFFIGMMSFTIVLNTLKIEEFSPLSFLGLCFGLASMFDLIHALTTEAFSMVLFNSNKLDISLKSVAMARYIESISLLTMLSLIGKESKWTSRISKIRNINPVFIICSMLLIFIFLYGVIISDIPNVYVKGIGTNNFKLLNNILSIILFSISLVIFGERKKHFSDDKYKYLKIAVWLMILSEVFMISISINFYIGMTLSHLFKISSFIYVYLTLVKLKVTDPHILLHEEISQRKKVQDDLQKTTKLYEKLIELLPDAVYIYKSGGLMITNKRGLQLTGYRDFEYIKNTELTSIAEIHENKYDIVSERINKLMTEEVELEYLEQKIRLKDGKILETEIGGTSFKFNNDHYTMVVVRDISERKRSERLERKIELKERLLKEAKEYEDLKTQFFTTISHELRTPLNVILGTIQLVNLTKDKLDSSEYGCKMNNHLKVMKQNCYRLLRLISNLIDITRLDSGFLDLKLTNYNIISVIEEITLSVSQFAQSKDIDLIFDTEIEEKIIAFDIEKIERTILNLLSNSIKFTDPKGKLEVNIYDNETYISISVKDTGIGIPPDMREIIFDRFRQVDSSIRRRAEGSGIGLSLVKSIVDLHEGQILVESNVGEGSEFIINLPVRQIKEKNISSHEADITIDEKIEKINIEFSDIYF